MPLLRHLFRFAQIFCIAGLLLPFSIAQSSAATHSSDIWWKHAVVYEIYPRSFQDSNGDSLGDLNGITSRLDYLQHLGVDAIWIAPMYPSPQVDFGYDISNYEQVDPQYGTLQDFDRLLAQAKRRKIRVLLDMVLNHTSDQHPWFIESSMSKNNPRADWYVWNDGLRADSAGITAYQKRFEHEGMVPPNNWESLFGGSAWEWSATRRQFYYHKFYKQQPDLNWTNPAVEKAMFAAMRFWLDRGVAGFRLDAIPTLFEDPQLRNEPETGGTNAQDDPNLNDIYTNMLPGVHDVLRRMRAMVERYPGNRVLIGETYLPNTAELNNWYGAHNDELQLPMDMLVGFHSEGGGPSGSNVSLDIHHLRETISQAESELHGNQPLFVFDNHDNARSWDRFGDGAHDELIAKIVATLLYTTRATALTYYGAEIGMRTTTPTHKEEVKDPIGITGWPKEKGRDGERTPMQWTAGPQAGFSTNPDTWLPIPASAETVNVAVEQADATSLLRWNEDLIRLRRSIPALHDGDFVMLDATNPDVLSFLRKSTAASSAVVVCVNMSNKPQMVTLDASLAGLASSATTLLTDAPALIGKQDLTHLALPPYTTWIGSTR